MTSVIYARKYITRVNVCNDQPFYGSRVSFSSLRILFLAPGRASRFTPPSHFSPTRRSNLRQLFPRRTERKLVSFERRKGRRGESGIFRRHGRISRGWRSRGVEEDTERTRGGREEKGRKTERARAEVSDARASLLSKRRRTRRREVTHSR